MEVRNLCLRVPRKQHGVSLLGSAANTLHCVHVGLGQPAEAPTQTIQRVEKAPVTLPAVMAPLQRRMEGGLRQTLSVLLGSAVSGLTWE